MEFNINSPMMLSILFFSGIIKETRRVNCIDPETGTNILIKTGINKGSVKSRNEQVLINIEGLGLKPHKDWMTKKEGIYSTNEAVLKTISKRDKTDAGKIASLMLDLRGLEKELGTYYNGYEDLIHDHSGCVHAQFSHCGYEKTDYSVGGGTASGRLSCTKPNVQQLPRGDD